MLKQFKYQISWNYKFLKDYAVVTGKHKKLSVLHYYLKWLFILFFMNLAMSSGFNYFIKINIKVAKISLYFNL